MPSRKSTAPGTQQNEQRKTAARQLIAEASAMFIYVAAGAGSVAFLRINAHNTGRILTGEDWLFVGLAHGLMLFVGAMISMDLAGVHMNPAVTVGLAVVRQYSWRKVPLQIMAQMAGAVAGAACILLVYGNDALRVGLLGGPVIARNITLFQAALGESLGTTILVLPQVVVGLNRRVRRGWGMLASAASVLALTLEIGPATTAIINPARGFGPDFLDALAGIPVDWGIFALVFIIGPIAGAAIGAWLLRRLLDASGNETRTNVRTF